MWNECEKLTNQCKGYRIVLSPAPSGNPPPPPRNHYYGLAQSITATSISMLQLNALAVMNSMDWLVWASNQGLSHSCGIAISIDCMPLPPSVQLLWKRGLKMNMKFKKLKYSLMYSSEDTCKQHNNLCPVPLFGQCNEHNLSFVWMLRP